MSPTPERVERAARVFELRREGRTYRYIADALDVSVSTAHDLMQEALTARIPAAAETERVLEIERLDRMLAALEDRLAHGVKPETIVPVMLRVSERRARLMGLDAPKQLHFTGEPPVAPEVGFSRVVAEAERQAAADEEEIRDAG